MLEQLIKSPDSRQPGSFAERRAEHAVADRLAIKKREQSVAVQYAVVESSVVATKRFEIDSTGAIAKDGSTAPYAGRVRRRSLSGDATQILCGLAQDIRAFSSMSVLVLAPPAKPGDDLELVTRNALPSAKGAVARTKEHFPAVNGPALFGMDFDTAEFPGELLDKIRAAGSISKALAAVFPPFADAACLRRASVSNGVRRIGGATPADTGHHRYFVVPDGTAIEGFIGILADRLMLAGFLWGKIFATGKIEVRTLFDIGASNDPSRLWYEADGVLEKGLEYAPGAREPHVAPGGLLDITGIKPLSSVERERLENLKAEVSRSLAPQAAVVRQQWEERRVADLIAKGRSPAAARRAVSGAAERHYLSGDCEIQLDDGTAVSIDEILADRNAFHGKTCADPLEPDYNGGTNLAIIYTKHAPYVIRSQAHGGIIYHLPTAVEDWFEDLGDPVPTSSKASENVAEAPFTLTVIDGPVDPIGLPVRDWLVQPRLPIGDVAQCVGEPGVSKSTLMLRDALAVATEREDILRGTDTAGQPISPERLHVGGPVIVYNAEDRADEMKRRLVVLQRHFGIAEMRHPIVLWSGIDHAQLTIMRRENDRSALKRTSGADMLERTIRQFGAVLVILDPQISLTSGSHENNNEDQDALLQELARMASRQRTAIVVVHHTAKHTRNAKGDIGAGRGGFAAVGKVRSAFTLVNVTGEDDEAAWKVSRADNLVRLDYAKISHDRKPAFSIVFRRKSIAVGNGHGVQATAAAALFDENPREALRATGDYAPVLDIVDTKALIAEADSKPRDTVHAAKIAEIADTLMGDDDEMLLSELRDAIGVRMREYGVNGAKQRSAVTGYIVSALGGDGVELTRNGQVVRMRVVRKKAGRTTPWWLTRSRSLLGGAMP